MGKFERVTDAPQWDRITPKREPGREADVLVPRDRALFGAFAWTLIPFGAALGATYLFEWSILVPAFVFVVSFCVMLPFRWERESGIAQRTIWSMERIARVDLDGDKVVGEPAPRPPLVVRGKGAADAVQGQGARADEIRAFLEACYRDLDKRGRPRTAEEYRLDDVGGDRDRYCELRDAFIRCNVASWNVPTDHTRGWSFLPGETVDGIMFELFAQGEDK